MRDVCVNGMVHLCWGQAAPNTGGGLLDQTWGLFKSFIHSFTKSFMHRALLSTRPVLVLGQSCPTPCGQRAGQGWHQSKVLKMSSQNTIFLLSHASFHFLQVLKKLMSLHLPITSLKREARLSPHQLSNLIFVVHVLSLWVSWAPEHELSSGGPPHLPWPAVPSRTELPEASRWPGPRRLCQPFLRLKVGVSHLQR